MKIHMIIEMRTCTLKPAKTPDCENAFEEGLEHRVKLSPLAAGWFPTCGSLNQWVHIWPYKDMGERSRFLAGAMKLPNWPPATVVT